MTSLYNERLLALARATTFARIPPEATTRASLTNPLCGDEIEVGLAIVDGHIEDIGFVANACAVCTASASAMAQRLQSGSIDRFGPELARLEAVVRGEPEADSELTAFASLADFPSRRPCALLPWRALDRALHAPASAHGAPAPATRAPVATDSAWSAIRALRARGEATTLATLISVEGSSPCPIGSKMVVGSSGEFWGSVSGGCVESAIVRASLEMLDATDGDDSQLLDYTIANSQQGELGLPCGGRIRVHLCPAPTDTQLDVLEQAESSDGSLFVIPLDGGPVRIAETQQLLEPGEATTPGPRLVEHDGHTLYVEPLARARRLVLVGGTHIAQKLARLAAEVGLAPIVVDPRTALANPGRFPDLRLVNARPEQALPELIDERTAVVMLTHDAKLDDPALEVALTSPAYYVGALGSRKTQRARLERLRARGLDDRALSRLHGPAGVPIGGQGAAEIALSILAEIVAVRRMNDAAHRRIGAVVLAAGASRRAGDINKLLHPVDGEPMIRRVVRTTLDAGASPCLVVLGHQADAVRQALHGLPVEFVFNERHTEGMGTSIARGFEAMTTTEVGAAFIVLGDMPFLRADDLEQLMVAYQASTQHLIVAPEAGEGKERRLGNPVLWPRRYFAELTRLSGDRGAKRIMMASSGALLRVPVDHAGVLQDIDTPTPAS
ncbi:MAG: XdhC family protein [Myxococcota bacterium]